MGTTTFRSELVSANSAAGPLAVKRAELTGPATCRLKPRPIRRATRRRAAPSWRSSAAATRSREFPEVSGELVVVELPVSGRHQLTLRAQPVSELIGSALFEVDEVSTLGDLALIELAAPRLGLARAGGLAGGGLAGFSDISELLS